MAKRTTKKSSKQDSSSSKSLARTGKKTGIELKEEEMNKVSGGLSKIKYK